ncbi:Oidioi.mRNA.OKI2018_I69.PAR.g12723.t1.cds [Oikopleura dioica]|uniref:Oidioi.mRNA.OKI2018_I69.PAR.g12723.t1.cds n=1 Tax=Oikopleura dioica TaxID=34765 RepID=A0ABN7S1D4_OIKDI|nr:Oidioi.mRNA.OKI2018_I69.PAR.g12723.t1.cds [Oikopleura dioica]
MPYSQEQLEIDREELEETRRRIKEAKAYSFKVSSAVSQFYTDIQSSKKNLRSIEETSDTALKTFNDRSVPENHKFALHVDKFHKISTNKLKMNKLGRKMKKFKRLLENSSKKNSTSEDRKVTASLVSMKPGEERDFNLFSSFRSIIRIIFIS